MLTPLLCRHIAGEESPCFGYWVRECGFPECAALNVSLARAHLQFVLDGEEIRKRVDAVGMDSCQGLPETKSFPEETSREWRLVHERVGRRVLERLRLGGVSEVKETLTVVFGESRGDGHRS